MPPACPSVNSRERSIYIVMPGLDPGIHHFHKKMDCRIKSGNDELLDSRL